MADTKISALPAGTELDGTEIIAGVQSGVTVGLLSSLFLKFDYTKNYVLRTIGWALKADTIKLAWFSSAAVGSDWSPVWRAAHNWVEALPAGGVLEFPAGFDPEFKTPIVWNPNKVLPNGNGAHVDCSAQTGAYIITLRQTNMDANSRPANNRLHPWLNTYFNGNMGATHTTLLKLADVNPISGTYSCAGVTLRDCQVMNFWQDIEFGNGAFHNQFSNVTFGITGLAAGGSYGNSLYMPGGLQNAGENISFSQCLLGKPFGTSVYVRQAAASWNFQMCSGDYNDILFDVDVGMSLQWLGYIETNKDVDHIIKINGSSKNTLVTLLGDVFITGNKTAFELFYIDPAVTNGGLVADINLQFSGGITYEPLNLLSGTGRAKVKLRGHSNATTHPAIGGSCNSMVNGNFVGAGLGDWTLAGSPAPAISATYGFGSSTQSMKLAISGGNSPVASRVLRCEEGDTLTGELYYRTDALAGTGGRLAIELDWLDAGGNLIYSSAAASVTTNVGAWTRARLSLIEPAPTGADSVRAVISGGGAAGGAGAAYIGGVQLKMA